MANSQEFTRFEELYWSISRSMNYIWKSIFDHHFPGSQAYILFVLEKKERQKMTELADALNLTPGAVTSSSNKLIANEFIRRVRDEEDRRVVYLEITEKGKKALNGLRQEGRKAIKAIFSGLTESDIKTLVRIFEHAEENMNNLREELAEWNICQKNEK